MNKEYKPINNLWKDSEGYRYFGTLKLSSKIKYDGDDFIPLWEWVNQLQQENKQLKSILTDLEEWCNDGIKDEWVKFDYGTEIIGIPIKIHITSYEMVLDKMKELQGSDSNVEN